MEGVVARTGVNTGNHRRSALHLRKTCRAGAGIERVTSMALRLIQSLSTGEFERCSGKVVDHITVRKSGGSAIQVGGDK